ncbi:MAG: hypothetical protein OXN89_17505 [Bryobacterales bacterium]|nr:hypothetical protein [Bryobacterales bacterium]
MIAVLLANIATAQSDQDKLLTELQLDATQVAQAERFRNDLDDIVNPLALEYLQKGWQQLREQRGDSPNSEMVAMLTADRASLASRIFEAEAEYRRRFRGMLSGTQILKLNEIEQAAPLAAALRGAVAMGLVPVPENDSFLVYLRRVQPYEVLVSRAVELPLETTIGPPTGPAPAEDDYERLSDWTVASGRVRFLFFSAGQCITLGGTINGVTYAVHTSKWQRRANADSPWTDVTDTVKEGSICSYTPDSPGEYRGVAEISIGGVRGRYATDNTLTYP